MKRKQFIEICNKYNVKYEIWGTVKNYGFISLDAPNGFVFYGNDIHYKDLQLNGYPNINEAYQDLVNDYLMGFPEKCKQIDCEICK